MKRCSKCKEEKPKSEFSKTRTNKDGLSYLCSPCNKESSRKYRKDNAASYYERQQRKREEEPTFIAQMLYNATTRAKNKGLDIDIDIPFLTSLLEESNYKCAVSGQDMTLLSLNRKKANPFRVSLDRIDSSKGYTKENVRLVCWAVNQMKADRTEEEFAFWITTLYKAISSQA